MARLRPVELDPVAAGRVVDGRPWREQVPAVSAAVVLRLFHAARWSTRGEVPEVAVLRGRSWQLVTRPATAADELDAFLCAWPPSLRLWCWQVALD